jgi:hypothetical protein
MTVNELGKFVAEFQAKQLDIMAMKGQSYSGAMDGDDGADRLANFKRVGKQMGVSAMTCWLCYFLKHVDSVATFIRTGHESEGFESRALDLANYAILGAALLKEEEEGA